MKYLFGIAVLMVCGCKPRVATEEIRQLLWQLESSSCVVMGPVGLATQDTHVGDAYKTLVRIAPDSIWVRVSFSKKPVLRMYAFEALRARKSSELEAVRNRLKNDTAEVCWKSNDMGFSMSIGAYVKENGRY